MARTGRRGRRIYRHNGVYYVPTMIHYSGHLSGLGLEVVDEVPRSSRVYQKWLNLMRLELDRALAGAISHVESEPSTCTINPVMKTTEARPWSDNNFTVHRGRGPTSGPYIHYAYEIDLDNEVFYINDKPIFRLDNMPKREAFVKSVVVDSYGHYTYSLDVPKEHRCSWRAPPPEVDPLSMGLYNSRTSDNPNTMPIHELLDVSEPLLDFEKIRLRLLEVYVGSMMAFAKNGATFRIWERIPNCNEIPRDFLVLCHLLAILSTSPAIDPDDIRSKVPKDDKIFMWLRPQLCLRIATHLDDEDNLKAAIGDLVREVMDHRDAKGVVYGVCFSLYHCAVVHIDVAGGGGFKHTPGLQFLPSFYTDLPSTPGITALARLGCMLDPLVMPGSMPPDQQIELTRSPRYRVPLEIWMEIASHLFSANDLLALASISPHSWSAANVALKYPSLGNSRITGIRTTKLEFGLSELYAAEFDAFCAGGQCGILRVAGRTRVTWGLTGYTIFDSGGFRQCRCTEAGCDCSAWLEYICVSCTKEQDTGHGPVL